MLLYEILKQGGNDMPMIFEENAIFEAVQAMPV